MKPLRVAILSDFAEERWFSMDLVAQMLTHHLRRAHGSTVQATRVRPKFIRFVSGAPLIGQRWTARAAELFVNRFVNYPRWLRAHRSDFDVFHVVDHSYSQLVNHLPADRTVVTCHDLDAFRCVLEPGRVRRAAAIRWTTRLTLDGFRRAARISCVSRATRDEILGYGLVAPDRTAIVPNGVHPACSPKSNGFADVQAARLLGPCDPDVIELLHVGSTIPRKRVDLLLQLFRRVRDEFPNARLVRVGGPFTHAQAETVRRFGLADSIVVLPFLRASVLAAVYRRAALVLVTSEAEGFGLPVIEAMACGTPVIATDIASLREVGGEAARYCPNGDTDAWRSTIVATLREATAEPEHCSELRAMGQRQAAKFSWAECASKTVELYRQLAT